jgi:hypothetical protein
MKGWQYYSTTERNIILKPIKYLQMNNLRIEVNQTKLKCVVKPFTGKPLIQVCLIDLGESSRVNIYPDLLTPILKREIKRDLSFYSPFQK